MTCPQAIINKARGKQEWEKNNERKQQGRKHQSVQHAPDVICPASIFHTHNGTMKAGGCSGQDDGATNKQEEGVEKVFKYDIDVRREAQINEW